jgi:hypothetical protein
MRYPFNPFEAALFDQYTLNKVNEDCVARLIGLVFFEPAIPHP